MIIINDNYQNFQMQQLKISFMQVCHFILFHVALVTDINQCKDFNLRQAYLQRHQLSSFEGRYSSYNANMNENEMAYLHT